jgi:galactokinase/galacturonokinase
LGAHIDHQHGIVTGFAIDQGIDLFISETENSEIKLISKNF